MSTQRELLKRALDLISISYNPVRDDIKAELAKPEQEPDYWLSGMMHITNEEKITFPEVFVRFDKPVYTSPPQHDPLSSDDIYSCFPNGMGYCYNETGGIIVSNEWLHAFAHNIEKRLIK